MVWFTPVQVILADLEQRYAAYRPIIAVVQIGVNLAFLAALVYGILYGI